MYAQSVLPTSSNNNINNNNNNNNNNNSNNNNNNNTNNDNNKITVDFDPYTDNIRVFFFTQSVSQ